MKVYWAYTPLSIQLHDGLQTTREWKGPYVSSNFHIIQIVEGVHCAVHTFRDPLFLLDRYFLTVPALEKTKIPLQQRRCARRDHCQSKKSPVPHLKTKLSYYQRTPSKEKFSKATSMLYFRKHFFRLLGQKPESCITQIIQRLQEELEEH